MKSSFCSADDTCVEVQITDEWVYVRSDTKLHALVFTHAEWQDFVNGVKTGEFDI